ncbi:MAG: class I SAM-dependent methyltransferase [Segetibacter sp.]
MNTEQAYQIWAEQYDTNDNKTRDLEAEALKETLANISFNNCLEVGCGTGKNTAWLIQKAEHITAVDFSSEMLAKAKEKITSDRVQFKQGDITKSWTFTNSLYDLISFSLVLEHISELDHVFSEAANYLNHNGHIYIGELHPYKQYSGSKARFNAEDGLKVVECFTHNISDFTKTAKKYGLILVEVNEHFDNNNRQKIPRILTLLLRKS